MKKSETMKGSAFLPLLRVVQSQGNALEQEWLSRVPSDERAIYLHGDPGQWYPIPATFPNGITEAAKVLFPDEADGIRQIGTLVAKESLRQVPLLIRASRVIPFLRYSPLIWRLYHARGKVSMQNISRRGVSFTLSGRPDFEPWYLEFLDGFFVGCIESFGLRVIRLVRENQDPMAWKWTMEWQS